jgi:protein-arginine kinase activator protein McsA
MTPRGRVVKIDKNGVADYDYDDDHYEEFSLSDRNNEDGVECEECGEKFKNFMNSDVCENCYETLINIA